MRCPTPPLLLGVKAEQAIEGGEPCCLLIRSIKVTLEEHMTGSWSYCELGA